MIVGGARAAMPPMALPPSLSKPLPLALRGADVPCPPTDSVDGPRSPEGMIQAGWTQIGRLQDRRINELSGVAPSRTQPGVMWVHNDSGDSARVFAIGPDGATRATITVAGTRAYDWEDITIAPGPDGRDWVWVADTGDNLRARGSVQLYGFPEPDATAGDVTVTPRRIDVTYPGGGRHDVEAFFVDPVTRDGYLITKERTAPGRIMRLPAAQLAAGTVKAEQVGLLAPNMRITAGDIRRDGSAIVLRDYDHVYAWPRIAGDTIAAALQRAPVRLDAPDGSEAIAFQPGGQSWISIPEGRHAPMFTRPVPAV